MRSICILFLFLVVAAVVAMPPISVVASVKGKKFDIVDVETIAEFTERAEELAGLEPGQSSVLFGGILLTSSDRLEDIGVSAGDILMVVKGRKQRTVTPDFGSGEDLSPDFESSLDTNSDEYKEFMKNADPEDVEKAMKAMDNLLDTDFADEYFTDDEMLEEARLHMLASADQYEGVMPGFKEQAIDIASDPAKWKEAMQQAIEQISMLKQQRDARKGSAPEINRYRLHLTA